MSLVLELSHLPPTAAGTYEVDGRSGRLAERQRFLAPEAARDFLDVIDVAVCSDVYRSPASSLEAIRTRRGALPPGFSPHNFGKAIDLALALTRLRLRGLLHARRVTKPDLDAWFAERGWYCFRTDGKTGRSDAYPSDESWHYNHLGRGVVVDPRWRTTGGWIEALITTTYGSAWSAMRVGEAQRLLRGLRFYGGAIDDDPGPLTRQATRSFQRAWALPESGALDARTRRTLAVVAAEIVVVPPAA